MELITILFFVFLGGSAFTLRGIWGHQLGGGVMGVLIGLGISLIFDLPLSITIEMTFWLFLIWALAAMVGWARYKTIQRFFRGYIFYALIPNIIIGYYVYSGDLVSQILLIFVGSLGMGIGFGISYKLLLTIRNKMQENYKKNHGEDQKICWGDRPLEKGETSHIFVFYLDTWKIFLEVISGALYGLTMYLVFSNNSLTLRAVPTELSIIHYIMAILCFTLLPMGLGIGVILEKGIVHGWAFPEEQKLWEKKKTKITILITIGIAAIWSIVFLVYFEDLTNPLTLFLTNYWIINILAKFYNPIRAKLYQADCVLDTVLGIILTIVCFLIP